MVNKLIYLLFLSLILFSSNASFAEVPASQQASGQERIRQLEQQEQFLRKKIEEKKEKPQIEEKLPQPSTPAASEQKVFIQSIRVTGATLIPKKEIDAIITPYKKGMHPVAEKATQEVLSLPIHPMLKNSDIDMMANVIRRIIDEKN